MAENWIQGMNRLTGPAPCTCSITGPHQMGNPYCPRNAQLTNAPRTISEPTVGMDSPDQTEPEGGA